MRRPRKEYLKFGRFSLNITILKEKDHPSYITGGGCAVSELTITIDPGLPIQAQKEIVIHEVIEGYLPFLTHDKVEDLTEILINALDEIN